MAVTVDSTANLLHPQPVRTCVSILRTCTPFKWRSMQRREMPVAPLPSPPVLTTVMK